MSDGTSSSGTGAEGNRPTSVLLVEDELLIRWAVAEDLRGIGWTVYEAATADDAIEFLRPRSWLIWF
jgi:CheY-like chemotaxis protein